MGSKSIDNLVADIYKLFDPNVHHECSEDNLDVLAKNIVSLLKRRLSKREDDDNVLRFSNIGKKDRQLWYKAKKVEGEALSEKTLFKFVYGDIMEEVLLFFAKESGHDVHSEQKEIEVDGVKGHIDAVVDGYTVDVKSASPFSYKKFADGSIVENDPFGYMQQLGGYTNEVTPDTGGAFLAFDKVHGDICLSKLPDSMLRDFRAAPRIEHLKEVIQRDEAPERCFEDLEDGKSGNRKLGVECSYCKFKEHCWSDSNDGKGLRTFIYANGPRFLTRVEREPEVYEVSK